MITIGLTGMAAASFVLSVLPAGFGVVGYVACIAGVAGSYALFQAANNTGVMKDVPQDRRGLVSGMLNLSRNLGLVTGASAMGAVFAFASARAGGAAGLRITFGVAAGLIVLALAMAAASRKG